MNCFTHSGKPAVGMCVLARRGVCRECVALETSAPLVSPMRGGGRPHGWISARQAMGTGDGDYQNFA